MQIESLGDAFDAGMTVSMRCAWGRRDGLKSIRECQFGAPLDMLTLVCTRGRDFPLALLAERMRCPRCGSRRVRLLYGLPGNAGAARQAK